MDFYEELQQASRDIVPGDIDVDGFRTINVNREKGFELPKEQFLDIFAGNRELHSFPHSGGTETTGYLFEVLHLNIFAATFSWLVNYKKEDKDKVVIAKDYVNKAKGRCRIFGTVREINEAAGQPIGIVLTVGGLNSGKLLDIVGHTNNYRTGLFYKQIVEPTEILLDETGKKILPLKQWYIPIGIGEAVKVTSKRSNSDSWYCPVEPAWTNRDVSEIKKAKNAVSLKDTIVSHLFIKGNEYASIKEALSDEANQWIEEQNQFFNESVESTEGKWLQFVVEQRLRLSDPIEPLRATGWNMQAAIEAVMNPAEALPAGGGNGGEVSAMTYANKGNEWG